MGPNDAQIIRVYTRELGAVIADFTIDSGKDAEVVVDVEAGLAALGGGGQWQLGIVIKDLVNGNVIAFTTPPPVNGNLGAAPWSAQDETFAWTVPSANLTGSKGDLCQVYAYLLVGNGLTPYYASYAESPVFLVLP
jgi:hypothetical protein